MKLASGIVAATMMAAAGSALAVPDLQIDINGFQTQAVNSGGAPVAFGGLTHTGAVQFSLGSGLINGIGIRTVANGPFVNAGFTGTLADFTGQINLNNGLVTGGSITVTLTNGDTYTTLISAGSGMVSTYVGGGFKIEALTHGGMFNDSMFANVDVTPWFNAQSPNGLPGSLLQFNFNPDAGGASPADMDLFVSVPLPPAAWAGLGTLVGLIAVRRLRHR